MSGVNSIALNHFDECGTSCHAEFSESRQKLRLSASYCKCRHCEPCGRAKANTVARNLKEKLMEQRKAAGPGGKFEHRFITLTLKHNTAPLHEQIQRLKKAFKDLRKQPCWKLTQKGGGVIIEVKWTGKAWHPHLHVISQGSFMPLDQLSAAWRKVTGDSFIVDIQNLKDDAHTCHYVTKYMTKGVSPAVWENVNLALEWITASKSVRACDTFGSWRGFRLMKKECGVRDWKKVAKLIDIIKKAQAGEEWARGLLLQLRPPGSGDDVTLRERPSG